MNHCKNVNYGHLDISLINVLVQSEMFLSKSYQSDEQNKTRRTTRIINLK